MEHTLKAFDEDLAALSELVSRLAGLAAAEVADSLKALIERDVQVAADVVERDGNLDELQIEIENRAIRLLALRQPVAIDLRRAVAAMKMAGNLERCGDLAKNIAKRAVVLVDLELPSALMRPIERMGRLVRSRLETAVDAYVRDDLTAAHEVWHGDHEVDEHYDSLFRELLTYMMGDPRLIGACTHLLFIAKNLERIGDHATNLAELVHYEMTGEQLLGRTKHQALP